MNQFLLDLKHITEEDEDIVGKANVELAEMIATHIPIAPGFVITSDAYFAFLHQNKLIPKINGLLETVSLERHESAAQVSMHIKKLFLSASFDEYFIAQIYASYKKLSGPLQDMPVKISSQKTSFHSISGDANIMLKLKEIWASIFETQEILHRQERNINHFRDTIAILIQREINADESGVALTANPMNNDRTKIIIEVQGVNEHHEIQKSNLRIFNQVISTKKPLLTDKEVVEIAEIAKKLELKCYFPQEIYWAKEKNQIYIVRTKMLHINDKSGFYDLSLAATKQKFLAKGIGVSPGLASGKVKLVKTFYDANSILPGEIVVLTEVKPDYLAGLKKASAFIAEAYGRTSYTAQIARELGIPAVIGVDQATKKIKPNFIITVNGRLGEIYINSSHSSEIKTATHIFITLSSFLQNPSEKIEASGVLLFDDQQNVTQKDFPKKLADICKQIQPAPVVYKLTDYNDEKKERLGFRGTFRSLHQKSLLEKELQIIQQIRSTEQIRNLWVLMPFMRSVPELVAFKNHLKSAGLDRGTTFKLWMTVATTANVIKLEEFIATGIDGICIDLDELTALITGVDHTINEVAHIFDPLDQAVLWALEKTIKTAQKHSLATAIYGQSLTHHPALIEMLVTWGISTICIEEHTKTAVVKTITDTERGLIEHKYT